MGVQLNIKDAETVELARTLAAKLRKSVTETIREALEHRSRQLDLDCQARIDAMNAAVEEFQKHMPPEWKGKTSKEIMDAIYDEDGLPI